MKRSGLFGMILLSIVFHFGFICSAIFLSSKISSKRIPKRFTYYEVTLVEAPVRKVSVRKGVKKGNYRRGAISVKREEKAIVIAKKKVRFKKRKRKKVLIEKAIEKRRKEDYIERRIAQIRKKVSEGFSLSLYKLEIESRIKSNWIYPFGIKKNIEAILVVKVRKDGRIMGYRFKKRSNDSLFDSSVIKAIEKSNPLPPFPEGYKKSYEEIEIRFNLSELSS